MLQCETSRSLVLLEHADRLDHSGFAPGFTQVSRPGSVDIEPSSSENKLGCARGVVWALIFETALICIIWAFCKLCFNGH
jgi:hypothetical protein